MNDLIEILEERFSPEEIIEIFNDISEDKIEDYAISHSLCVKCGGNLIVHRWLESRGECRGFPCKESMSELVCESCGEVYD